MALVEGKVIAIAGLNQDPYAHNPTVARLRHLYVQSAWRGRGVGKLMVSQIISHASQHYRILTLRTDSLEADKFYRALSFKTNPSMAHATHYLKLENN